MIEFKHGDILTSSADIICQQVNCKGVMGRGLAKQIRDKWPDVFSQYQVYIESFKRDIGAGRLLGSVNFASTGIDTNQQVANCFGQDSYGVNGTYTDLSALKQSLETVRDLSEHGIMGSYSIAIPYNIGAGLGGANPDDVHQMLTEVFKDYKGVVEFWIYES